MTDMTGATATRMMVDGWSPAGRRTWMQAAAGGRWEDSRGIDTPAADREVRSLVRAAGAGDVAVEFEWLGHPLVFVGARRAHGEDRAFEDAAVAVAEASPADPAVALAGLAGAEPGEPLTVELGAANAWRSIGPLRLWTRGDPPFGGSVDALLDERPDLRSCVRPVALEVTFDGRRQSWIGRELSRPTGGRHVTDPSAVDALLRRLFAPDA